MAILHDEHFDARTFGAPVRGGVHVDLAARTALGDDHGHARRDGRRVQHPAEARPRWRTIRRVTFRVVDGDAVEQWIKIRHVVQWAPDTGSNRHPTYRHPHRGC